MKYGNRSIWKRVLGSPISLVVAGIVLVVLVKATWNISSKTIQSAEKLAQAQAELARLNERQSELQGRVGLLSTDQGIEAEIRTKFRAVREGESVAVIVDEDDGPAVALLGSENIISTSTDGWFRRMLRRLGF